MRGSISYQGGYANRVLMIGHFDLLEAGLFASAQNAYPIPQDRSWVEEADESRPARQFLTGLEGLEGPSFFRH
jgi:hypothetical protein